MQTTLRGTKFNGDLAQGIARSEQTKTRATPLRTVSTAPVLAGLAHLIHQINNPLQAVYGAAGLMDQEMPKTNNREDPFVDQVFQQLKGGVEQLVSLVSSLGSQLECFWLSTPYFKSVNLNSLIDDILQSEAMRCDAGGIQVRKSIAANLPPIQANEKLLKQALANLLRNAVEAMPEGGVLSVRAGACERSVSVELADTGGGMDRWAYIKVAVSGLTGRVRGAYLRLLVRDGSANGPRVYRTSSGWSGGSITWRNRPGPIGDAVDDLGRVPSNRWIYLDVTSLVDGDGTYSFQLRTTSGDGLSVSSIQGSRAPRLVVQTAP